VRIQFFSNAREADVRQAQLDAALAAPLRGRCGG
jgi:hypothetical protein